MNIFLKVFYFLYKHGHWTVSGRVSIALLNLLLSVVLTKLMTVDGYGNYQYYLSFFLLLEFFSTPGAFSAVVKYVALGYDWSCDYLLKLRLKYSLLASIFFIFFGLYNIFVGNFFESLIYFAFAIIFPFYHSYDLFASFLHAKIELKRLNILYVVRSSFQVLATILAYFISKSVEFALITFIASIAIVNWLFYKKTVVNSSQNNYDIKIDAEAKKMAIGLSLIGILGTIVGQIDKILIFNLIDSKSLAVFSIGMMIGISINSLFKSILSSLDAKLVIHNIKTWHYWVIFSVGSVVGLILALIMPFIIEIIYDDAYIESAYYASVVSLSLGAYLVIHLLDSSNTLHHKKDIITIYISRAGVSAIQLIVILILFLYISSGREILRYLPFVYILKILLQILLIHVVNFKMQTYDK